MRLPGVLRDLAARALGLGIVFAVRLVAAPRAIWMQGAPVARQRIYFANHTSNADMPLIWAALPPELRGATRAVAAADYWTKNALRRFVGRDVLNTVMIDRRPEARGADEDPLAAIREALDYGSSLILFPEGRRNEGDEPLLPLKAGLYNLAVSHSWVELVPVWIGNLNRVMPRGEVVPIPLVCTVAFGAPMTRVEDEPKDAFLARAARAMLALRDVR